MVRAAKSKIAKKEKSDRLYQAILTLETEEECYNFFQDLCTISELRSMEQRYEVASLLNDGMIYNDILEKTGASSATISRVNRSLIYGNGGYESVLEKMRRKRENELLRGIGLLLRCADGGCGLRKAGGLSGKAVPPQPHPREGGAGSGLRHRHHDVAADGARV